MLDVPTNIFCRRRPLFVAHNASNEWKEEEEEEKGSKTRITPWQRDFWGDSKTVFHPRLLRSLCSSCVGAGGNMGEGGEFLSLRIVPGTTVSSFRTHKHLPHMVPDPPLAAPDCLSPTVGGNAAPFTPHLFSHGGEKQTSHFWRKFDTPHPPCLPPIQKLLLPITNSERRSCLSLSLSLSPLPFSAVGVRVFASSQFHSFANERTTDLFLSFRSRGSAPMGKRRTGNHLVRFPR